MPTIEALRQFTLNGYAIFDFVVSFLGIYLLSPVLSKLFLKSNLKISRKSWILLVLPISILSHILVGNITPMTQDFININDNYILKILILGLLVWGIRDIKIVKNNKK